MSRVRASWSATLAGFVALAAIPCVGIQHGEHVTARKLLQGGRLDEAERLILSSAVHSTDAGLLALQGEIRFRRADFDGAAAAFRAAIRVDERCARAYWGLGRLELIQFHRNNARSLMSRAYGLDPRDPDIIRSYTEFATDPKSRETLLKNAIALTVNEDRQAAAASLNQLVMEKRLNGSPHGRLASGYRPYTVALKAYQPHGLIPAGLLTPVSINGGKILWLVLDSGASGIVINPKAAKRLDLDIVSETQITGLGGGAVGGAMGVAHTVRVGEHFQLENCAVEVLSGTFAEGADGVIGMDAFEAFQIRLDARSRTLELTPFESGPPEVGTGRWIGYDRTENSDQPSHAYGFRHFLLLRARVQGGKAGLFLVDTGSAVTSVARGTSGPPMGVASAMLLNGATGAVEGIFRISPLVLEVAGRTVGERDPVSMDLDEISRRQGVQISGILGYSVLRQSTVTINYRDGLVALGPRP